MGERIEANGYESMSSDLVASVYPTMATILLLGKNGKVFPGTLLDFMLGRGYYRIDHMS